MIDILPAAYRAGKGGKEHSRSFPAVVLQISAGLFFLCILILPAQSQVFLGNYTGHAVSGKQVTVSAGAAAVRFIFYQPDILRVDFLPFPGAVFDSSFSVIQDTTVYVPFTITDAPSTLKIETGALGVVCQKSPLRISYYDAAGNLLLSEPASGGLAVSGTERWATFSLHPNEHFYGTGERSADLDKRGQVLQSFNTQHFSYDGPVDPMNINVPFLASTNGYALFFDQTYPGAFDLGASDPSRFFYKAFGGELRYYLLTALTIPGQIERYTWLTGRQPLPPRWALGYIQSKYGYRNEGEAREMVETMREKQIPCDAIVLDLYWFEHMGDLAWNLSDWPDPGQMMQEFLAEGFKTIVITEPYIVEYSGNFSTAAANDYLAFDSQGEPYLLGGWWSCNCDAGLLDITNPAAREWGWSRHPAFMGEHLAGLWTDLGEPERHEPGMQHLGGSRDRIHNVYNLLWAKTLYEGFAGLRPNRRMFNLTRSGFAGIQRYGALPWSGDVGTSFGGLQVQLPMLLGMGISGLAYHHSDIGGFCCETTTPELYIRWLEHSVFSPVARAHGVDYQPQEPWGYGMFAENIARKYIQLRYRLLPYNYTLVHENYSTGMPLARPLFFIDPANPNLINESSSYLWGEAFLVSPVVQAGQSAKTLYLPPGDWIDFWTDQVYEGNQAITVPSPLETLPLFVKSGSIIPMQPAMNYSDERPLDTLLLAVYPSLETPGQFTLYEDDGETLEYQNGSFARTSFSSHVGSDSSGTYLGIDICAAQGSYNGMVSQRVYLADVHTVFRKPAVVIQNGATLPEYPSLAALRQGGDGFFYESAANRLYIQTAGAPDSAYTLIAEGITLGVPYGGALSPQQFELGQNYPNPFNPTTVIPYRLGKTEFVTLKVYDVLGREVATLVNEPQTAGDYTVEFDSRQLAQSPRERISSGVYFYKLTAGNFTRVRRMVLLK